MFKCPKRFSDDTNFTNIHVPGSKEQSLSGRLQPAEWLPIAFFDSMKTSHTSWSISTFHMWVTQFCPHVHKESATVYGGLLSVRTIAFALSCICQNMSCMASESNIPLTIQQVVLGPKQTWSSAQMSHLVNDCISSLFKDVAKSRSILQVTDCTSTNQWEERVRILTEQHLQRGTAQ